MNAMLKALTEAKAKMAEGPVLLHVFTEKGHGFKPAAEDPVLFHAPPPFERDRDTVVSVKKSSSRAYTDTVSDSIFRAMEKDPSDKRLNFNTGDAFYRLED